MEELGDLAREGGPPGHHVADVAPEEGVNAGEDEPVCHRARHAQPRGECPPLHLVTAPLAPDGDGPVEQGALERAAGLASRQDATIHLLVDAGDRRDEVWAGGDHVLHERVDAPGEGRGRARRDADVFDQSREGVGERQEEEVDIPFSHDTERERRLDGREVIAVRLEHALRRPRRPRGVDDGRERIAAQGGDAPVDLGAEGPQGGAAARHEAGEAVAVASLGVDRDRPLQADGLLHAVELEAARPHLLDLPSLLRVLGERDRRLGVREDVATLVGQARGVDGHRDAARGEDRKVDLHPFRPGAREERHAVAGSHPHVDEPGCDLADPSFHLSPRDLLPPVGPPVPVTGTAGELTGALEEHVRETGERHARALLGRGGAPTLARPAATV